MKRLLSIVLATIIAAPAFSQQAGSDTESSMAAAEFHYTDGTVGVWRRPPEAQFAIISGCGGGAGGSALETSRTIGAGGGSPVQTSTRVGPGGRSSEVFTVIVPLIASSYEVVVGAGGDGGRTTGTTSSLDNPLETAPRRGRPGDDTVFRGGELNIRFAGASSPTQSELSIDGEDSLFGLGGSGATSLADGASNASARCAGGGGLGRIGTFQNVDLQAGRGGHGYLVIVPVPDLARFARVLDSLESLSAPPEIVIEDDGPAEIEPDQ